VKVTPYGSSKSGERSKMELRADRVDHCGVAPEDGGDERGAEESGGGLLKDHELEGSV
jgi:hypothetical protein